MINPWQYFNFFFWKRGLLQHSGSSSYVFQCSDLHFFSCSFYTSREKAKIRIVRCLAPDFPFYCPPLAYKNSDVTAITNLTKTWTFCGRLMHVKQTTEQNAAAVSCSQRLSFIGLIAVKPINVHHLNHSLCCQLISGSRHIYHHRFHTTNADSNTVN